MAVASSTDLKTWSPVSVAGPLFRFDGADAPGNTVLEFAQPVALKGRYLRLTWEGYEGVVVASVTGRMASTQAVVVPVRAALPAGTAQEQGLVWSLGFATPMAALHLQATQNNTLVPVRIQGRNDASQAWRTLAPAVLYRLDTVGPGGSRNAPTPLYSAQGASVRWLRVETTNGTPLLPQDVQVTAEFAPVQLAFLASGAEPFTLALGRAQTPAGAMDASLIGAVLGGNSASTWAKLPIARISSVQQAADAGGGMGSGPVGALVARFGLRSIWLWTVLVVGVLVLGAVAFSLVRQLGAGPNTPP
jgi:hypothetical protein